MVGPLDWARLLGHSELMTTPADHRVKVPMTADQRQSLAELRDPDSVLGRLFQQLVGAQPRSDAATAALLIDIGLHHLKDIALDEGYAALAKQQATPQARIERQVARERRDRIAASWDARR
jgi:hypothetical protein